MSSVRVLSESVNNVVVQLDGRRYPALVVQGDRLKEWLRLASAGDADSVEMLADELRDSVDEYDRVTRDHGVGMGY